MKECPKCGSDEIYRSGQCAPCKKAYAKAYRELNKEAVKSARALNYKNNKEKILAQNAEYRKNNKTDIDKKLSEYREANREKLRAEAVEYRRRNPEKLTAYRMANREKLNANSEIYRVNNLDVFRRLSHNRRARVAAVGGVLSKDIEKKLYKLQNGKCPCCKEPLGDDYHIDHVVPIALGGTNTDNNVQLLRKRCNLQKNKKHPIDYMQSKGFLL